MWLTKDVALLWWLNFLTVALSYGYGHYKQNHVTEDVESTEEKEMFPFLKSALRALDYGSGRERGKRVGEWKE